MRGRFKVGDIVKVKNVIEEGTIIEIYFIDFYPIYAIESESFFTNRIIVNLHYDHSTMILLGKDESRLYINTINDLY